MGAGRAGSGVGGGGGEVKPRGSKVICLLLSPTGRLAVTFWELMSRVIVNAVSASTVSLLPLRCVRRWGKVTRVCSSMIPYHNMWGKRSGSFFLFSFLPHLPSELVPVLQFFSSSK